MLKNINLKHTFYFWAVAKENSISKASALLNVSQSSISEQVKVLESRVGTELFDRSQNKMIPTASGKALFETLDQFFPEIERVLECLIHQKNQDVVYIRVGLCPTLSQGTRYSLCLPFVNNSGFTMKVVNGENRYLTEAFEKEELDLFFTTNDNLAPKGFYERMEIAQKSFCIVTSPEAVRDYLPDSSFPLRERLKALSKLRFINYTSDSDFHFKSLAFLGKNDIHPPRIAEIDDIGIVKKLIKETNCFSMLPYNSVNSELEKGELVQVHSELRDLKCRVYAIYKPNLKSKGIEDILNATSQSLACENL